MSRYCLAVFFFLGIFLFNQRVIIARSEVLAEKINLYRQENDLKRLKRSPQLDQSALSKACDLNNNDYFSHFDKQGRGLDWWLNQVDYHYMAGGENLAKNHRSPEKVLEAWINSPLHRDNLLSEDFEEIGVGYCDNYVVAHFGKSLPKPIASVYDFWDFLKLIFNLPKLYAMNGREIIEVFK